jgi:phosphoribosylamine--glycine ligase
MNVLLLGGGGREHALAWKMSQSPLLTKLFIAPGNAGTALTGENVPLDVKNFEEVKRFVLENLIEMVVVGPEEPLVKGIRDFFLSDDQIKNIPVIGPSKQGAMLEGSKDFANEFMSRNGIPTAGYRTFKVEELEAGFKYLAGKKPPYVLKADGLAAGKGVLICETLEQANASLKEMLVDEKFGDASAKVVIEDFLAGIELSVFVLTDGQSYKILPEAKDYKRIGEGDTGLNTGGMGSISPVPFADADFMNKVENRIIRPTIEGLINEKIDYKGFIFFGLIRVGDDPYVIEYNVRMGDPEAESVIPRIKSDLLELFKAVAGKTLDEMHLEIDVRYTAAVFLVSGGYPGSYQKGKRITGLDLVEKSKLFHAGTTTGPGLGEVITSGGRVLAVYAFGNTMKEALDNAYTDAKKIDFEGKYYRKDLGQDLLPFVDPR